MLMSFYIDNKTLAYIISKSGYHFYTTSSGVNSNVRGVTGKKFFQPPMIQLCLVRAFLLSKVFGKFFN
jgi:hypothetical protein